MPVNCKICKNITYTFGRSEVMGKYKASYQRCSSCGFIFLDEPFWLAESYVDPIANTDIGTISRCDENSRHTKAIIELFLNSSGAFLDFGAGFGIFVRRMRDLGYSFSSLDPYCKNLFASTFCVESLDGATFDMITAFEVIEHAESPMEIFDCIFGHTESLFFTTEIIPDPAPGPDEWWYYGLDHGQHISFFTESSLQYIATRSGKKLYSDGARLHFMTSRPVNKLLYRIATKRQFCRWFDLLCNRRSLLEVDYCKVRSDKRR